MQFGSAGAGSATHLGCVVAEHRDGHQYHPRAVQRHRPGDAGSGRAAASTSCARSFRPPSRRSTAAMCKRTRDHDQRALAGAAGPGDDQGTRPRRAGLYLERAVLPKGTPADVVKKLNDAMVAAMNSPSVKDRLQGLGATIVARRAPHRRPISASSPRTKSRNGKRRSRRAAFRSSNGLSPGAVHRAVVRRRPGTVPDTDA